MKYALVQFQDGKRQTRYLVLTKDIKGFEPSSASDIPDKEYLVKWQKSFTGEDGQHDDGYYEGKILIVGASPDEIRAKAKELKIRLPPCFPPSEAPEVKSAMKRPLRKHRQKANHEVNAKVKRMNETRKLVELPDTPSKEVHGKADEDEVSKAENLIENGEKEKDQSVNSGNCGEGDPTLTIATVHENREEKSSYSNLDTLEKKMNPDYEVSESGSSSDEGDATELLDKLRKEHRLCETKIQKLESTNSKLKDYLKTYKNEMQKKRETLNNLKDEIEELKSKNFNLLRVLRKIRTSGTSDSRENKQSTSSSPGMFSSSSYKPSPMKSFSPLTMSPLSASFVKSPSSLMLSPSWSPTLSSSSKKSQGMNTKPSTVKRELFGQDTDVEVPLVINRNPTKDDNSPFKKRKLMSNGPDNLEGVTQRIFEDLKGVKPLEGDDERLYVGMGTYINKTFWEKTIRRQRDDSKFVKDCAQAIWGLEKLKCRTVERKSKTRPIIATPEKVNFVYAMLRGKLLVRELSKPEQDLIINNAKMWLGQKMYDCGRQPKKPKE